MLAFQKSETQATERTFWAYVLSIHGAKVIRRDSKHFRSYRKVISYLIVHFVVVFWGLCMVISLNVQYNGRLLADILLLT